MFLNLKALTLVLSKSGVSSVVVLIGDFVGELNALKAPREADPTLCADPDDAWWDKIKILRELFNCVKQYKKSRINSMHFQQLWKLPSVHVITSLKLLLYAIKTLWNVAYFRALS